MLTAAVRVSGSTQIRGAFSIAAWRLLALVIDCVACFKKFLQTIKDGTGLSEGLFTQNSSYIPKENPKKNPKNPRIFFRGFNIRIHYLGENNSSMSVFKSFFIHKILVHLKYPGKNPKKNPEKNPKKSEFFVSI